MAEYRINYTQSNFTGGVIAAELYGRNDFNKVKTGLKKCTNWTIREAGGLEFRRGTRYINTVPAAAGPKFKVSSIGDVLIVFGAASIYYLDADNEWQSIAYPAETKSLYAWVGGFFTLSDTPSAGDQLYDSNGDAYSDAYTLTAYDSGNDAITIEHVVSPGVIQGLTESRASASDTTADFPAYPNLDTLMFEELKQRLYYYDGEMNLSYVRLDDDNVPYAEFATFEKELTGASVSLTHTRDSSLDPRVDVDYTCTVSLISADGEKESIAIMPAVTVSGVNAELSGTEYVTIDVTISQDLANEFAGGRVLIYKRYQGAFYYLNSIDIPETTPGTTYQYVDKGEYSVDTSKSIKRRPAYLTADGHVPYVNSIADYGQRLYLTLSLKLSRTEINMIFTQTGNIDSLAYTEMRNDDEAGYLAIPITRYDEWGRVVSGLELMFGTSYTIQHVTGYGNMQIEPLLFDGISKTVQPVRTRRSLIYTNPNNRNIYDLSYNEYGQYDNPDLTLLVKYIFEEKTIKRLEIKDYPVKTIYVLCTDGDLYCLTYIKEQNIYAWYKIEHYGTVHDIHVINKETEDEIYIVTKDNGNYIVELAYHRTDTVYMDAVVLVRRNTIGTDNVISGLPAWMNGKKVRVFDLGNNLYYGDYDVAHPQTVEEGGNIVQIDDVEFDGFLVSNGSITLPESIELEGNVLVGLPYYAIAETIPLEFSDQNGNSTIGRKKTISDAYLRYGDSRGLTYKTLGREYDCGICKKDMADNAEFLERGQIRLNTESEYKWDSTIKLLQRTPYPARIESITLGINFNDKS